MSAPGHTADLFGDAAPVVATREDLAPRAVLLRAFALPADAALRAVIEQVTVQAPCRQLLTPGGRRMSVAMSNCGSVGWISDRNGYRYAATDPVSGRPWPALPAVLLRLAADAAAEAGFDGFVPDACLINRYVPGASMGLHQDRDERDPTAPIVSVSLGVPAVFLFGGALRSDRTRRVALTHGDVVVWGGASRLNFHGIAPLKAGNHPFAGECRLNLTFRKAL